MSSSQNIQAEVGIVVPTLGERVDWLRDCIASIVRQIDSTRIKVVLVGPDSPNIRAIAELFDVQVLFRPARGLSAAINEGFALLSDCEFVTWLGDDDLLAPGSLLESVNAMRRKPTANFVYGNTRYIDKNGASIYSAPATSFAPIYMRWGKDFVPQPGSLLRGEAVFSETPPVDPQLRNAMDLDLFLRLSRPGRKSWSYINTEVSAYRLHDGAITANKGGLDESDVVRARYTGALARRIAGRTRSARLLGERALVWLQWRLCKPAVPLVNGVPYTQPGAYLLASRL